MTVAVLVRVIQFYILSYGFSSVIEHASDYEDQWTEHYVRGSRSLFLVSSASTCSNVPSSNSVVNISVNVVSVLVVS